MKDEIKLHSLNTNEINIKLKNFITNSSFTIKEFSDIEMPYKYRIEDVARKIKVNFICKNITKSGWEDKPDIVRIQIKNISDMFIYTNKNEALLLCGLCEVNDKWLLVVWNAYRYMNHKTNRSCYVYKDSLKNCYENGYGFFRDFNQETWICDEYHFNLLVRDYILFTYGGE